MRPAVIAAAVACFAVSADAAELVPGQAVQGELVPGEREPEVVYRICAAGPLTLEAKTPAFELGLEVQAEAEGAPVQQATPVSGVTRLVLRSSASTCYRVRVLSTWPGECLGEFELKALAGEPAVVDAAAREHAEQLYWTAVDDRAAHHPDAGCRLEATLRRGLQYRRAGDPGAARPRVEDALRASIALHGERHGVTAMCENALGLVLVDLGQYGAARPLFERALATREALLGPDDSDTLNSANSLAGALSLAGEYAQAEPLFARVLDGFTKLVGPQHGRVALSAMNLAATRVSMGRYADAAPLYERALAIKEAVLGKDHPDVAVILNKQALLLYQLGTYAAARPLLERALTIDERALGSEHPQVALTLANQAVILNAMGLYPEARHAAERSLALNEARLGAQHVSVAESLSALAAIENSMGDRAAARAAYARALAIREAALGPEHPLVASSLESLGLALDEAGGTVRAKALLERALAIRLKKLGVSHRDTARSMASLAQVDLSAGDAAEARRLTERAIETATRAVGPEHPDVAAYLSDLADLEGRRGAAAKGLPYAERALAIRTKQFRPRHPLVADSLDRLARLLADAGQPEAAFERSLAAEEIGRAQLERTIRWLPERDALRFAAVRAAGLDVALRLAARSGIAPGRALDALVRGRGVVFDEMTARQRAAAASGDPKVTQLAQQLAAAETRYSNLLVRGLGDQAPEAHRAVLEAAEADRDRLEEQLAAASEVHRRERARTRIGLDEVRASLPPRTGMVAFRELGRRPGAGAREYVAFVVRAGEGETHAFALGDAAALDAAVQRWRADAYRGGTGAGSIDAYRRSGAALRRLVWDPLAAALLGLERVVIVPDGSLSLVNVPALPSPRGGFLVDEPLLVGYVASERDLVREPETAHGAGLLALGGAAFDEPRVFGALRAAPPTGGTALAAAPFRGSSPRCTSFGAQRFAPLPETSFEAEEIARLWSGAPGSGDALQLVGSEATESAFKRLAPGRRVLHLATHGFFLEDSCGAASAAGWRGVGGLAPLAETVREENPLRLAGLALAGANHRDSAAPGEDDGVLTAEEIAALDLGGTDLAVLSGCDTGVGALRAGEGVFGLGRAFQRAGVRSVVVSFWPVEDKAARELMRALYAARFTRGLDAAAALREAARAVEKTHPHPFFWGGFVVVGQ